MAATRGQRIGELDGLWGICALAVLHTWLTSSPPGNGPLWSLRHEIFFYARLPLLWRARVSRFWLAMALTALSLFLLLKPNHMVAELGSKLTKPPELK